MSDTGERYGRGPAYAALEDARKARGAVLSPEEMAAADAEAAGVGPLEFTSPQSPEAQAWLDKVNVVVEHSIANNKWTFADALELFWAKGYVELRYTGTEPVELVGWVYPNPQKRVERMEVKYKAKSAPDPIHNAIRKMK